MHRRQFLQRSLAAVAGTLAPVATGLFARPFSAPAAGGFSLCVLTDRPDRSVSLAGRLLTDLGLSGAPGNAVVSVTMDPLAGEHVGDVVFFRDGLLYDYRGEEGRLADVLRGLASEHDFPRPMVSPLLVTFRAGGAASCPTTARVFQGDVLVEELSLDLDRHDHRIDGSVGSVTLAVSDRAVRITEASCRHKTCVNMGPIHRAGASLVCIPNRLSVTLDGADGRGLDGLTG